MCIDSIEEGDLVMTHTLTHSHTHTHRNNLFAQENKGHGSSVQRLWDVAHGIRIHPDDKPKIMHLPPLPSFFPCSCPWILFSALTGPATSSSSVSVRHWGGPPEKVTCSTPKVPIHQIPVWAVVLPHRGSRERPTRALPPQRPSFDLPSNGSVPA